MHEKDLAGVFPYLVSPVESDGKVKEEVLRSLVDHLIKCGVHGLTPLGSTGEFAYLTWEQRKKIIEVVIDATSGRVPVVSGVAHTSVHEAVRQAKEVETMGVDGILAIMESYFPVSAKGVVSYFKSIGEAVSCPVVLYTNPSFSSTDLSLEVIEELAKVPNIRYLKDASANTGNLLTIMNHMGKKIKVFSASAHIPLFVMMLGGVGWMAGPSCVIPRQSVKLYDLAFAKRWDEAILLQKRLWGINRIFQKYSLAPCIKACLELQGFAVGDPIPPLQPLRDEALKEIGEVLRTLDYSD
ncbi:MAG TPA: dihydrodipicolinate synthase family protein [Thermodesulfobacteriota bacterium]|nr:dihydrodipicolinate synthase family protein [Thermodesulfobacteriota bacterium]